MEKTFNPNIFEKPEFWMLALGLFTLSVTFSLVFGVSFWLMLAGILFILSLILIVQNPLLLLSLLIIARMSLDYSAEYFTFTFFEIPVSLSQLLGISIAVLGVIIIILHRKALFNFPLAIPALVLLLWEGFTLSYSIAPYQTLQEALRFFGFFTLGFLAYISVKKIDDFKKLLSAFFISGILPVILALYQWTFGIGIQDDAFSVPRIFGTFSHPNVFSLYLFALIVFAWLFSIIFARSSREKTFTLCILGIFAIVLLLTFTRIAWLALFIFTLLLALFHYRFLLFPLVLLPLVLFTFSQNFQERLSETFAQRPDSSIIWRKNLWRDVTTESVQSGNLWFGSGMNTFPIVSENLRGITFGSNDSHNDFIKFFVEGGIIGLIVYLIYISSIFFILIKNYFQIRKQSILQLSFGALILFFFVITIASLSENVFRHAPVQWLFFSAFGGLLALARKEMSDKR
jgi:O-antigen ligase